MKKRSLKILLNPITKFKYIARSKIIMSERTEALMRIVVGVISGIIIGVWKILVNIIIIIHWFYVLFAGKRSKALAEFCNSWATQVYRLIRYMTFATNSRPFPFSELGNVMHPVELKQKDKK